MEEELLEIPIVFGMSVIRMENRIRPLEHYIQRQFLALKIDSSIRDNSGLILYEGESRYRLVDPSRIRLENYPPMPGFIEGDLLVKKKLNAIESVKLNRDCLERGMVEWKSIPGLYEWREEYVDPVNVEPVEVDTRVIGRTQGTLLLDFKADRKEIL